VKRVLSIILPAVYLASSWTWVIGMWFPVYLVADFGWPGWVAFAVPNVIGAAAMGWVLRRAGAPDRIVREHPRATWWFSVVTVAFQASVLSWLLALVSAGTPRLGQGYYGPIAASLLVLVAAGLSRLAYRRMLVGAVVVYVFSVVCALLAWRVTDGAAFAMPAREGTQSGFDLLCIVPVLVFGFALCPYLDLTFLRVRRETPGSAGTAAFVVGFGVLFLAMIVLTLMYAGAAEGGRLHAWLVAHVVGQGVFTMAVHLGESSKLKAQSSNGAGIGSRESGVGERGRGAGAGTVVTPVVGAVLVVALCSGPLPWLMKGLERTAYEAFMSFYGLTFPAFVWIAMVARGLGARARMLAWAGAVAVGLPLLWFGWTGRAYWMVPPAIVAALAAPFVARALEGRKSSPGGEISGQKA